MLGPKAHLARTDKQTNKPRRRRENFGAFFKHFEPFQWVSKPKFSKGRLRRRFQRGPSAPAGPSYARAPSSFPTWVPARVMRGTLDLFCAMKSSVNAGALEAGETKPLQADVYVR